MSNKGHSAKYTGEITATPSEVAVARCTVHQGKTETHHLEIRAGDGFDGIRLSIVLPQPDALLRELTEAIKWLADEEAR